jgi:hypothetical protein
VGPGPVMTTNDLGQCYATGVILGVPVATNDNCGILLVTNNAPPQFPVGTSTVTWTTWDVNGNSATAQQTVTVHDTELPTMVGPGPVTTTNDRGQCYATGVALGAPVATNDNCGILLVTNNAPAQFAVGTNVVTWTAVDASGNTTTWDQWVTVVAPPYVVTQPANQVVQPGQSVSLTLTAADDCGKGLTYQWRWNGGEIAGATDNAYTRTNVQCADAGSFDVVVTNVAGAVTSAPATLTVLGGALVIDSIEWDRSNQMVFSGTGGCEGGVFCVVASANALAPLTNWLRVATNAFGTGGSFCVTNTVNVSNPPQFFRLLLP